MNAYKSSITGVCSPTEIGNKMEGRNVSAPLFCIDCGNIQESGNSLAFEKSKERWRNDGRIELGSIGFGDSTEGQLVCGISVAFFAGTSWGVRSERTEWRHYKMDMTVADKNIVISSSDGESHREAIGGICSQV